MKITLLVLVLISTGTIKSQELMEFFQPNMLFSENKDTVPVANGHYDILFYDSLGREMSFLGYDHLNRLKHYKAGQDYYYENYSALKQVGWNKDGKLCYYVIIDSSGNELYWNKFENGEINQIRFDVNMEGTEFTHYKTGELKLRVTMIGDSHLHEEFYINGKIEKRYTTYGFGSLYMGAYEEYDSTGQVMISGQYHFEKNDTGVLSGRHGEWIYYTPEGKIKQVELYEKGNLVVVTSGKKRKK